MTSGIGLGTWDSFCHQRVVVKFYWTFADGCCEFEAFLYSRLGSVVSQVTSLNRKLPFPPWQINNLLWFTLVGSAQRHFYGNFLIRRSPFVLRLNPSLFACQHHRHHNDGFIHWRCFREFSLFVSVLNELIGVDLRQNIYGFLRSFPRGFIGWFCDEDFGFGRWSPLEDWWEK